MPKLRRAKLHIATAAPPAAPDIRYYTDETGASIVEHSGGRFKLNRWTGKYEPHDG